MQVHHLGPRPSSSPPQSLADELQQAGMNLILLRDLSGGACECYQVQFRHTGILMTAVCAGTGKGLAARKGLGFTRYLKADEGKGKLHQ